jgi:protein-tyrosine-phosphatase
MSEHQKRILFVCASRSIRALMAANLLTARTRGPWDIWHTPAPVSQQEHELARQVLDEMGIALLSPSQETEPSFGLTWDEGIILCSGLADT